MKRERVYKYFPMIISAVIIITCMNPVNVLAAKSSKKTKPWAAAYKKIVKELEKEYKDSEDGLTYSLIYFDKNKTPELVAGITGYWVSVYTFEDGKVYTVMDQWGYGAMGNAGYEYLPKKNVLRNYNSDLAGASSYVYYGKIKDHEIKDYYKESLRMDMFIDKNKNGFPDEDEFLADDKLVYYYGDKKISEKKFNSYLIDGEYKPIYGKYSKKEILKKLEK